MSRILTIAISALMLAGCSSGPLYDKSAVPSATAAMREATALCEKEQTASKLTACHLAAERNFAVAIHLPKMEAFDTYAAGMMTLAADWEAGRVSQKQVDARATSIRNDYWVAYERQTYGAYHHPEIMIPGPYGY
jgi:PBP1b-binding outer membrane lipoprotein LpoB